MVNELSWRKFPRDTMRNEDLDYVSYLLQQDCPGLAAAPFLFYTTAYCKCDDEGVFDVEDGVIFARLMRLGTAKDVLKIAELLCERKIITRVIPGLNIFMLVDWEPPQRPGTYGRKALTAEERRRTVAAKLQSEGVKAPESTHPQSEQANVDFSSTPDANFFCPENDKNAKSVATNLLNDKIQKNVATAERDREIEREDRDTHREDETDRETRERQETRERSTGFRDYDTLQPVQKEIQEHKDTWTQEADTTTLADIALGHGEAVSHGQTDEFSENDEVQMYRQNDQLQVVRQVFSSFFAKNCLGFDEKQHQNELNTLAERMIVLADEKNPPEIIASVFCSQFMRLRESSDYYKTVPITSTSLLRPNTYAAVCTSAAKILNTARNNSEWQLQSDRQRLEAERDKPLIYDTMREQCVKYGIDPDEAGAWGKLIVAKKGKGG